MIRPATAEDAAAVARVQIASWRAAYSHLFADEQLEGISLEERTAFWTRFPPAVAEVDGEVVGFVAVGPSHDDDADGELYAIYVTPDRWDTGPGARWFYEQAGWATDAA